MYTFWKRFTLAIACSLAAVQTTFYATGVEAQHLFAVDYIWLWWIATAGWAILAIDVLIEGCE